MSKRQRDSESDEQPQKRQRLETNGDPEEKRITVITGNAGKLQEIRQILSEVLASNNITLDNVNLDLQEIQGSSDEISIHKAVEGSKHVKGVVLVEDVSLCFEGLGGLPGPYIKWFLKSLPNEKIYAMLKGSENYKATAECRFALASPNMEPQIFLGECEGNIVEPRGSNNFGWDPIFEPQGFEQTFAEMDDQVKNGISHRRKAADKLVTFIREKGDSIFS